MNSSVQLYPLQFRAAAVLWIMAPAAEAEGSEDVNDFLLRIRELGDKRDKEDEERTRKLEEDILKGRQERQARRAGEFTRPPT